MSVQYIVLLDHHAILFQFDPPTYTRTSDGWTCDYMHYRTAVPGPHPDGRMESARLMWILARILHPMPRLLVSLSLNTSMNNSYRNLTAYVLVPSSICHTNSIFLFRPRPTPVCYICRNRTTRPICNRCGARMFPVSRRPTSDQVNHCPVSSCLLQTILACSVTPLLRLSPFSKVFITILMSISGARTFFRKTR